MRTTTIPTEAKPPSTLGRRALGCGYLALALAPPALIVAVLAVLVGAVLDVVALSRQRAAAVAEIIDREVSPRVAAIEHGYGEAVRGLEHVRDEVVQVSRALGNMPDITIQRGQFGTTPKLPLRIPDRQIDLGLIRIGDGQFFNQSLPSVELPAAPISIPTQPIRQVLAPLGENGPIAHALADSTARVRQAVGQVLQLGGPLAELQAQIGSWFAPMRDLGGRIALMVKLTVLALAVLLVCYAAAAVHVFLTRRREAGLAFRLAGPRGCLRFVNACLFLDGYARLRGRDPVATSPASPDGLAARVEELEAALRRLRADFAALAAAKSPGAVDRISPVTLASQPA